MTIVDKQLIRAYRYRIFIVFVFAITAFGNKKPDERPINI
jgi:hypothetical protein